MAAHEPPVHVGEDDGRPRLHSHMNIAAEEASDGDNIPTTYRKRGLPGRLSGKEPPRQCRKRGFDPWVEMIPWRRKQTHSSILPCKIPWTEETGGLQSLGSQRVGHDLATKQQQHGNFPEYKEY